MRIMTMLDTIQLNEVLLASSYWTYQISYEAVASVPLEAAHAHNDDAKYDTAK